MTNEPIKIETENIFEPEEEKEPTFDELLGEVPKELASYLQATKSIVAPFFRPLQPYLPPPRDYKVRIFRFVAPDREIEEQLEDMLHAGWMLGDRIYTKDFVICIFSREQSKEDSNNG